MKVLDLFSGIGGFSLGLERAGMETSAFCEIDPFCRKVLKKHWPIVPIYEDVRFINGYNWTGSIDVICGGFPCQDISIAKKNAEGLQGERSGLWREYARIISEVRPRFVIVENVSALLHRGLADILRDLATIGYDAEWYCIPASYLGALHRRDRVWIIAYPVSSRLESLDVQESLLAYSQKPCGWELTRTIDEGLPADDYTRIRGNHDGVPKIMDRLKAIGNSVVPQIPEIIGRAIMEFNNG